MNRIVDHRSPFAAALKLAFFAWLTAFGLATASHAQESNVQIDPAQTKIDFSLGSTLHAVHGSFALKSATLRFDPASGKISGLIVVDAASGQSGNSGRDNRMHREILESAKFPEITFTPSQLTGAMAADGASKVTVSGRFRLHGRDHDVTLPVEVTAGGQNLQVAIHFVIPYVEWGLKNPSNFFLRASDKVEVDIRATAHLESTLSSRQTASESSVRKDEISSLSAMPCLSRIQAGRIPAARFARDIAPRSGASSFSTI